MDEHHDVVERDAPLRRRREGLVERVGQDDRCLPRLDLPARRERDGSMRGEVRLFHVNLVFERHRRSRHVGKIDRILPRSPRELRDEGRVRSDFFKDGEVVQPNGRRAQSCLAVAGAVNQRKLAHDRGSGHLPVREIRAHRLHDRRVETGFVHVRMLDRRVHHAGHGMRRSDRLSIRIMLHLRR